MASFEGVGSGTTGGQYYTLKLEVKETSSSVSNNTSVVSWALYLTSRNNYSFSSWSFPVVVNVDGEVYNSSEYRSMSANSTITLASGTKTISHNSDGKKTISCSATVKATGAYYLPGNMSVSGTLKLTDIPRYANFTEHYVSSTGLNSITVKWNADHRIDWVQYSLNGGAWTDTSGLTYTIAGLAPNTQYNIRTRIRRQSSQLWTESGYIYGTTKDIAKVTYAIDFNSDGNAYMEFTNPSGATVNLYLEIGSNHILRNGITGSGGYTFVLTEEERNLLYSLCPNSNSLNIRYGVETTVNGVGTYWHWADKKMTVVNSNPTFSNCEYIDAGTVSTGLTGDNQTLINGYNVLQVIISTANKAVAKNGATMSKYRLVCGNKSVEASYSSNSDVVLEITYITDMTFIVHAIDSRGNSTPVTKSVTTWKDYFKPVITVGAAERTEQVNKETRLTFSGKIWNNNFGAVQNGIVKCIYEYKKTTDSEYTTGETEIVPEISGNTFSASVLIKGDAGAEGFEISQSYNIKITIQDEIEAYPATYNVLLGAGKPAFAIHKDGVAFGSPYDRNIGGPLQVNRHIPQYSDIIQVYDNDQLSIDITAAWTTFKVPLGDYRNIGTAFTFDQSNKRVILNEAGYVDIDIQFNVYATSDYVNGDYIPNVRKNGADVGAGPYEQCNYNGAIYKKLNGSIYGISCNKGDYFDMHLNTSKTGIVRTFAGETTSFTLKFRRAV